MYVYVCVIAYQVLSSKLYRAIYDQLGIAGVQAKGFKEQNPVAIFEEFFGWVVII